MYGIDNPSQPMDTTLLPYVILITAIIAAFLFFGSSGVASKRSSNKTIFGICLGIVLALYLVKLYTGH